MQERLSNIPPNIWQRLFPFQREGVRRGVAHGGRCLLGDDMGLGKTVQARSLRFPVLTRHACRLPAAQSCADRGGALQLLPCLRSATRPSGAADAHGKFAHAAAAAGRSAWRHAVPEDLPLHSICPWALTFASIIM